MTAHWRHPLRNFIDRLKFIRQRLSDERHLFWGRHRTEYRDECARLLETQLMLVRPPDEQIESWTRAARQIAEAVAERLFSDGEWTGLIIFVSTQNLPPSGPLEDFLTFSTILDWVRAGREGDPLGKEFNDEDYQRSDKEIAGLVGFAISRRQATATQESLRRFVEEKSVAHLGPYLDEALKAWRAAMAVRVPRDFRAWLRDVIRNPKG